MKNNIKHRPGRLYVLLIFSFVLLFTVGCNRKQLAENQFQHKPAKLEHKNILEKRTITDTLKVTAFAGHNDIDPYWNNQVEEFYGLHNNKLLWVSEGSLNNNGQQLLNAIEQANEEGLQKLNYNLLPFYVTEKRIQKMNDNQLELSSLYVKLDIILTDALFKYAQDMLVGHVTPEDFHPEWQYIPRQVDLVRYFETAYEDESILKHIYDLRPQNIQYFKLKAKLQALKEEEIKPYELDIKLDSSIRLNDTLPEVAEVRKYLISSGDLSSANTYNSLRNSIYDRQMVEAVKSLQERHGIKVDGITGGQTLEVMKMSVDEQIAKIMLQLDRLRWMPNELGDTFIVVNIPEFELKYYEKGAKKLSSKVVVGKVDKTTPILKDTIEYLVFSPTWVIPKSISSEEMLPKIQNDKSFLRRNNYDVYYSGDYNTPVNADSIDWQKLSKDHFPYTIIQRPGGHNALGKVKFIFPNSKAVYLHDTPADYLFNHYERDFSHGCVRVEKPMELAEALLKDHPDVDLTKIYDMANKDEPQYIQMHKTVPVHFVYHTAWVDQYDKLHFREDIYGYDAKQLKAYHPKDKKAFELDEENLAMIKKERLENYERRQ